MNTTSGGVAVTINPRELVVDERDFGARNEFDAFGVAGGLHLVVAGRGVVVCQGNSGEANLLGHSGQRAWGF